MSSVRDWLPVPELPHALGGPPLRGALRQAPQDFQVDEVLGFEPDGAGEHVLLLVRKTGINTEDALRRIAHHAGVRPRDIGYCGLKDRNAVTTQWLSVGLAGRPEPDWTVLDNAGLKILSASRHRRKLKRGIAQGNRFRIRVGEISGDRTRATELLAAMLAGGVPNYFGEQRFGRGYGNLERAECLFRGELKRVRTHLRGLYLSAARSQVFNEILGRRVDEGSWCRILPGDVMQLEGSRSWFAIMEPDEDSLRRNQELDIHPTGPLWGKGALPCTGLAADLEQATAERFDVWCRGLENYGLKQERRALRLRVAELEYTWGAGVLDLSFCLPSGAFATTAIRELVSYP